MDTLSLRSAERRLELLHDVVSIRSDRSRRQARSVHTPPRKTVWRRFKDVFRTVIAFIFSNVGICVLVLVYLILGRFNRSKYLDIFKPGVDSLRSLYPILDMFFKLPAYSADCHHWEEGVQ